MFALITAAFAAEPVVALEGVDGAVARAAAATGRPADAFVDVPYAALRALPAAIVGGGQVTPCPGDATTAAQLTWVVQRVEGALSYGEFEKAAVEQAEAERIVSCLGEPADPAVIARVSALRALAAPDAEGAAAAFAEAVAVAPGLVWDEAWPPAARAVFDAAPRPAPVPLRIVAPGAVALVDGAPFAADGAVAPGRHVVHVAGRAHLVTVPPGGATLVVPAAFPATLDADDDPAALGALLAARFGEGAPVFVVDADGVFAATAGRADLLALARLKASPAEIGGRVLIGTGGVVTLGGGIAALASYRRTDLAADDVTAAESPEAHDVAERDYEDAAATFRKLRYVPIAGIAAIAIGLGIDALAEPKPVFAAPIPGGAMIGLRGTW